MLQNNNNKNRYSNNWRYQLSEKSSNDTTWCRRGGVGFLLFLVGLVGSLYHPSVPSAATVANLSHQEPRRSLKGESAIVSSVASGRRLVVQPRSYFMSSTSLAREVSVYEQEVREADADALDEAIRRLQLSSLELLQRRYGFAEPYRIAVKLQFPDDFPDNYGKVGEFTMELAPSNLQPHAVFTILEMIRTSGRIDAHLKMVDDTHAYVAQYHTEQSLAFPEHSPEYPHNGVGTVCYKQVSGPGWYINLADNNNNNLGGTEPTTCFGIIVEGFEQVQRMLLFQRNFELNSSNTVHILDMTLQVPNQDGSYVQWVEPVEVSRR